METARSASYIQTFDWKLTCICSKNSIITLILQNIFISVKTIFRTRGSYQECGDRRLLAARKLQNQSFLVVHLKSSPQKFYSYNHDFVSCCKIYMCLVQNKDHDHIIHKYLVLAIFVYCKLKLAHWAITNQHSLYYMQNTTAIFLEYLNIKM
jgi:hypothetical protein